MPKPLSKMNLTVLRSILLMALLLVLAALYLNGTKSSPKPDAIGGPFTLTNQDGRIVTDRDYKNVYRLVYFGFTSCPDICPVTLHTLAEALKKLGPTKPPVRVLFVTTDPATDTPAVLKDYLSMFAPLPVDGLTGTTAQIEAVEAAYKVYAQKVTDPTLNDPTIDHSTVIYFQSPAGRQLAFFSPDDSADTIAAGIRNLLKEQK